MSSSEKMNCLIARAFYIPKGKLILVEIGQLDRKIMYFIYYLGVAKSFCLTLHYF